MSSKLSIEELPIYLKTNIMILLNHRDFSSFLCVNREFWSIGNNNVNEEFGNITESLYFHRINKLFNKCWQYKLNELSHLNNKEFYYHIQNLIYDQENIHIFHSLFKNEKLNDLKILYEMQKEKDKILFYRVSRCHVFICKQNHIKNWLDTLKTEFFFFER